MVTVPLGKEAAAVRRACRSATAERNVCMVRPKCKEKRFNQLIPPCTAFAADMGKKRRMTQTEKHPALASNTVAQALALIAARLSSCG
jgi:hypothetical protein